MEQQNYHCSITANITAKEAFEGINNVSEWWAKKLEGSLQKLNDVFTTRFGETFVTFKVIEFIPHKKIVWLVTDCNLHWISDKKEWNDTRISFEISTKGDSTRIDMTHFGLFPGRECFNDCEVGWNHHIKESLSMLLTQHEGLPV